MLMSCSARSKVSHMTRALNREYGSGMLNIARGEVAKNAPQERFLYAPADDAPGFSREGKRRRRNARACGETSGMKGAV